MICKKKDKFFYDCKTKKKKETKKENKKIEVNETTNCVTDSRRFRV